MPDTSRLFPLSEQPPFIQLIVSAIVILFIGLVFLLFFLLAGTLLFGTGVNEIQAITQGQVTDNSQLIIKYLQATQGISLFIIPSFVISLLMTKGRGNWLFARNVPAINSILLVICLAVLMIPVTSMTGLLNAKMELPAWLSGIENWMRDKEDTASYLTGILLEADSLWILAMNIIVIAILPALGEELLFRGVIQQIFQKMFKSGHLAIWVTAIIFSSIHLQFYGFLPRLLLGLVFGYLFYWGRSIWLPVTAHFINNAIPVISSYFEGGDQTNVNTWQFTETRVLFFLLSALSCVLILLYFKHIYRKENIESFPADGKQVF
jgi:membrane protease YdiL (CAAX protease family)